VIGCNGLGVVDFGAIMVREITVQELARKISGGDAVVLVDVREPEEHAIAALPASVLIPMGELPQRWSEIKSFPDAEIVVYCHHGVRSRHAANYLMQFGLQSVVSLAGGIDAWSRLIDPKMPRY
jgi:rhodanese-related sulfurtransferase